MQQFGLQRQFCISMKLSSGSWAYTAFRNPCSAFHFSSFIPKRKNRTLCGIIQAIQLFYSLNAPQTHPHKYSRIFPRFTRKINNATKIGIVITRNMIAYDSMFSTPASWAKLTISPAKIGIKKNPISTPM